MFPFVAFVLVHFGDGWSEVKVFALSIEPSQNCERFEPRSNFKRLSLIVRVNVVLNRTVVVDSD